MDTQTITKKEKPPFDQMLEWLAKGIAEATDGCIVEPDGTCPHGCPSWFIKLEWI